MANAMKTSRGAVLCAAVFIAALAAPAAAGLFGDRLTDAEDGNLDLSDHLLLRRGFFPIPLLITEPALGYGGGVGLLFFRQSMAEAAGQSLARGERMSPPDVGGVAAFATANGSWGGGGGYFGSLAGDRFRYSAVAARTDLNLDYYGPADRARRFSLSAPLVMAQGLARLWGSNWFAGARYLYFDASARFAGETPPSIPRPGLDAHIGRLSLVVDYDSRDNIFTPNRGAYAEVDTGVARPGLGGSTSFDSLQARGHFYVPFGKAMVLGLRTDGSFTRGDVPFYARPYITLRGIPAMRYQGQNVIVAEAEVRINLDNRWALVVFGGGGRAYGGRVAFEDGKTAGAGGTGFRYLIARKLGLYGGMDIARGPEDTAVYFQFGSAWR